MAGIVIRWLTLLCLVSALHASGQAPWTWKDGSGAVRSRAELETILVEHRKWANSNRSEGRRANLTGATLDYADLSSANLDHADLSHSSLRHAILKNADLTAATLTEAHLENANLASAELSGGDLKNKGADLTHANLTGAILNEADFTHAILVGADLTGATLNSGTDLSYSDLYRAFYEPAGGTGPDPQQFLSVSNLADLQYKTDSRPIIDLRNYLRDGGNVQLARELTEAYHRHDQNSHPSPIPATREDWLQNQERWLQKAPLWLQESLYLRAALSYRLSVAGYWIAEGLEWLQQLAFDWTCGWGAHPGRPLIIIAGICLLCTPIYWIGLHSRLGNRGLFLLATGYPFATDGSKVRVTRIVVRPSWCAPEKDELTRKMGPKDFAAAIWRGRRLWLKQEFKALRIALHFSLMSVFNIGFEGFNGGDWIRMLQAREFDIRARGWMRTVSGLQSLLGLGLLALSILSYFGNPFG